MSNSISIQIGNRFYNENNGTYYEVTGAGCGNTWRVDEFTEIDGDLVFERHAIMYDRELRHMQQIA